MTQGRGKRLGLLGLVLGAAAGVAGCTGGEGRLTNAAASSSTSAGSGGAQVSVCAVTPVANTVVPSVVTIAAQGSGGSGTGSGEVIRPDGYILTNNHVISVAAGGGKVSVQFSDGQTEPATITGR